MYQHPSNVHVINGSCCPRLMLSIPSSHYSHNHTSDHRSVVDLHKGATSAYQQDLINLKPYCACASNHTAGHTSFALKPSKSNSALRITPTATLPPPLEVSHHHRCLSNQSKPAEPIFWPLPDTLFHLCQCNKTRKSRTQQNHL